MSTVLGFIFGIGLIIYFPLALGSGMKETNIFWGSLIMGGIYGFFIALITNLVVNERKDAPPTMA